MVAFVFVNIGNVANMPIPLPESRSNMDGFVEFSSTHFFYMYQFDLKVLNCKAKLFILLNSNLNIFKFHSCVVSFIFSTP